MPTATFDTTLTTTSYTSTAPTGTAVATSTATAYATASSPTGGAASPAEEIASSLSTRVGGPVIGTSFRTGLPSASSLYPATRDQITGGLGPRSPGSTRTLTDAMIARLAASQDASRVAAAKQEADRLAKNEAIMARLVKLNFKVKPDAGIGNGGPPKDGNGGGGGGGGGNGGGKGAEKPCTDCKAKGRNPLLTILVIIGIVVGGVVVVRAVTA